MSSTPINLSFDELVMRWFDGSATPAQQEAMWAMLAQDERCAAEFASMARFESVLKHRLRVESKALLEFVALESELAVDGAPPAPPPAIILPKKKWQPSPALRAFAIAAVALLVGALVMLWQPHSPPLNEPVIAIVPSTPAPTVTSSLPPTSLMRPRHDPTAPFVTTGQPVTTVIPTRPLAERLEDFYLPEVKLDRVTFASAAKWLTEQARALNYLKRTDIDSLRIEVPAAAQNRLVTLHSGPIPFSKAVSILSHLAVCQSLISDSGITITDRSALATMPARQIIGAASPHSPPPSRNEIVADAESLGLPQPAKSVNVDAAGNASVIATADQAEALRTLQAARQQFADLAPLSFMPVVLPSGFAKTDRVLSATETESIRQQVLAATRNVPVITVPRSSQSVPRNESAQPRPNVTALTLTSIPVGEMEILRLDSHINPVITIPAPRAQTINGGTKEDIIASANTQTPETSTSGSEAVVGDGQGVIVVVDQTTSGTIMYADDGTPIFAPPAASLALVPTGGN